MAKSSTYYLRRIHRFLGVTIGIQILFWTISGLYFTWTNIDDIHGDQFFKENIHENHRSISLQDLKLPTTIPFVSSIQLQFILEKPFFWINDSILVDAKTGTIKPGISESEALEITTQHIKDEFEVQEIQLITEINAHHEYRERPLPAWAITYKGNEQLTAYVAQKDGSFQRVRHSSWRIFDFLWMTHTMDYKTRDNFNHWLIRGFSALGLITVLSGFVLFWFTRKRKPSNL
jgi:hypothetical protein